MNRALASEPIGESCVICEQNKLIGIHLYTSFICMECEQVMINTETNDPKYKYYIEQLRKITMPGIFS